MKPSIRLSIHGSILATSWLLSACPTDEQTYRVPAGIRPEDAVFQYANTDTERVLAVMLSRADLCKSTSVTDGTEYVEVMFRWPLETDSFAGTCALGGSECEVTLFTTNEGCTSATGLGAGEGSVTLDSVSETEVRGSFAGTNADTHLDLSGTFIAKPCAAASAVCSP